MKKAPSIQGSPPLELDEHQLSTVVGGLIGPDQDLSDFPPWALPRIRITDLEVKLSPVVLQKAVIR